MKYLLPLSLTCLIFCACQVQNSGIKERSFAEQFAELENKPLQSPEDTEVGRLAMQSEGDRYADVEREAQKERRAKPPIVESEYIFQIKPEKSVYSYTEYNEVWTEEPTPEEYRTTKRLWQKPKRIKPNAQAEASAQPAEQGEQAAYGYSLTED